MAVRISLCSQFRPVNYVLETCILQAWANILLVEIIGIVIFYQHMGRLFIIHLYSDMFQDVVQCLQINSEKPPAALKQCQNICSHNSVLGCCQCLRTKQLQIIAKAVWPGVTQLYSLMWASVSLTCAYVCFLQFEGPEGEWFQKLTARFCSHQSWALDQIKSRQKKDPRFNSFILV